MCVCVCAYVCVILNNNRIKLLQFPYKIKSSLVAVAVAPFIESVVFIGSLLLPHNVLYFDFGPGYTVLCSFQFCIHLSDSKKRA